MTNHTDTDSSVALTTNNKSKTAKTKETISLLSTAVPLLGVLGTAFVWAAANFYIGTVDIKPAADYQDIVVQVFDQKGSEQQFHTPHFLLQPGKYHLAISLDKKGAQHLDTEVKLGATSNIKLTEPAPAGGSESSKDSRKHWWQIWKKSNPGESDNDKSKVENSTLDKSSLDKSNPEKSEANTAVSIETK